MGSTNKIIYCHPTTTKEVHKLDAKEILIGSTISYPPFEGCLWGSHPRVFLKLDAKGTVTCPYCKTLYRLDTNTWNG